MAENVNREKNSVYPRWRGEHSAVFNMEVLHFGLSPLARGTRVKWPFFVLFFPVYPRWRGEHIF